MQDDSACCKTSRGRCDWFLKCLAHNTRVFAGWVCQGCPEASQCQWMLHVPVGSNICTLHMPCSCVAHLLLTFTVLSCHLLWQLPGNTFILLVMPRFRPLVPVPNMFHFKPISCQHVELNHIIYLLHSFFFFC